MNQGRELTAEQVVEMAKSKLLQIYVPAGLSRSIGMPICEAVDMLTKLQEAWALDDARRNAEQQKEPDAQDFGDNEIAVEFEPVIEEAEADADRG